MRFNFRRSKATFFRRPKKQSGDQKSQFLGGQKFLQRMAVFFKRSRERPGD